MDKFWVIVGEEEYSFKRSWHKFISCYYNKEEAIQNLRDGRLYNQRLRNLTLYEISDGKEIYVSIETGKQP